MRSSCPCVGLWDELLQDAQILNVSGFGTTIFVCCDSFEGSLFVCSMQVAGYGLLCFIDVVTRGLAARPASEKRPLVCCLRLDGCSRLLCVTL